MFIDESYSPTVGDSVVCGPIVGTWFCRDRRTISILTSRDLVEVPENAAMRPVISSVKAQEIMHYLCGSSSLVAPDPEWPDLEDRDVLIAELAVALARTERAIRLALRRKDPLVRLPECPWSMAGYEYMGVFRVERGLIISDRCYVNRDHMLLALRTPALAGQWHAYLRYEPNFIGRTVAMVVVHENHFDKAKESGEALGFFGVDAGCAVIVDQRVLDDAELLSALVETSDWDEGPIGDVGLFAYTYDGDGMYNVRGIRHEGQIVAVRANVTRDEDYDYHTPPPPVHYTKSLDAALETAGPAKPYAPSETFAMGDRVMHKKFGEGLVTKIVDKGKVEISFPEGAKILVHGQKK